MGVELRPSSENGLAKAPDIRRRVGAVANNLIILIMVKQEIELV